MFAANLKAAIRGRGKPPRANSSQLYRSSLSSSHSFHTSPSEGYLPSSNGARNIHSQVHQTSRQQQPLPPVYHIQLPRAMPLTVMPLKTVTNLQHSASTATATELSAATLQCTELLTVSLSGSGTDSFCSSPKRLCCWKSPGS